MRTCYLQKTPIDKPAFHFLNRKRAEEKPYHIYMTAGAQQVPPPLLRHGHGVSFHSGEFATGEYELHLVAKSQINSSYFFRPPLNAGRYVVFFFSRSLSANFTWSNPLWALTFSGFPLVSILFLSNCGEQYMYPVLIIIHHLTDFVIDAQLNILILYMYLT